jgi:hypothetical protein
MTLDRRSRTESSWTGPSRGSPIAEIGAVLGSAQLVAPLVFQDSEQSRPFTPTIYLDGGMNGKTA